LAHSNYNIAFDKEKEDARKEIVEAREL